MIDQRHIEIISEQNREIERLRQYETDWKNLNEESKHCEKECRTLRARLAECATGGCIGAAHFKTRIDECCSEIDSLVCNINLPEWCRGRLRLLIANLRGVS